MSAVFCDNIVQIHDSLIVFCLCRSEISLGISKGSQRVVSLCNLKVLLCLLNVLNCGKDVVRIELALCISGDRLLELVLCYRS